MVMEVVKAISDLRKLKKSRKEKAVALAAAEKQKQINHLTNRIEGIKNEQCSQDESTSYRSAGADTGRLF